MNEQERKNRKAEIIGILHREKGSLTVSSLLSFLNIEIEHLRDALEDCDTDSVLTVRGAIGAFRGLKDLIEDGYPDFKS
jgi:DNA-binding phage protein